MAQYGYILDDLEQTPGLQRAGKAETWSRIIVGKSELSSLADLLGVELPVSKQLAPYCASKAHASALEAVGLVMVDDVLRLSVSELMGLLSRSVEAVVLVVTATLGAGAPDPFRAPKPIDRYRRLERRTPEKREHGRSATGNGGACEARALSKAHTPDGPVTERQLIREWARSVGYEVGERGRLPAWLVTAYAESHNDDALDSKKSSNSDHAARESALGNRGRQEIREWARQKGYEIGGRGRIPAWVVDAYNREKEAATAGSPEIAKEEPEERLMDVDEFLDFLKEV